MGVFDSVKKIVEGSVAHGSINTAKPLIIGGHANPATPTAVDQADATYLWVDVHGRPNVAMSKMSAVSNVLLGAASPAGSDLTADGATTALQASDFAIRDTNSHYFFIPMACAVNSQAALGYRSLIIGLKNHSSNAWSYAPTFRIWGCNGPNGTYRDAKLLEVTGVVTANIRMAFGTSNVGTGGNTGVSPVASTQSYYPVPAMADGWPFIVLEIKFDTAPAAGEIAVMAITRMAF